MQKNNQLRTEQRSNSRQHAAALAFMQGIERRGYAIVTNEDIGMIPHTFPIIGGGEGYILICAEENTIRVTQEKGTWTCHQQDEHWRVYDIHGVPSHETFPTAEVAREWVNMQERDGAAKDKYAGFYCTRAPHCPECKPEVRFMERCEILTVYCKRLYEPCEHCWKVKHEK